MIFMVIFIRLNFDPNEFRKRIIPPKKLGEILEKREKNGGAKWQSEWKVKNKNIENILILTVLIN